MGIARGPNIITEDLVFGYDSGYGIANNNTATRFYPGQPSVNLFGDISNANARPNRTEYNTSAWTANFPKPPEDVGRVYSHTSGSLNSTWSGNSYGYTLISYSYLANTTYTLSCWVYVSIDANLSSLATSMESTTLTHTANRFYDLNNKGTWQQISIRCNSSSAVNGNAIIAYPSRNGVTDGSHTGFWAIGGAKLEISDQVTPYVLGTRSDTASLIDLKRTTSIDVSNVSFDSTGQPDYDGSNDYLRTTLSGVNLNSGCTIEGVLRRNTTPTAWRTFFNLKPTGSNTPFFEFRSGANNQQIYADYYNGSADYITPTASLTTGEFGHAVSCYDGNGNLKMYLNGSLIGTKTGVPAFALGTSPVLSVGIAYSNDRYTDISAPVVKVYNAALSATQVEQNYKAYKNRFNI
tara:strand:+ start:79 stop:1299 length:1221 start_codon:yes stop_codon:yes gene_type:complete